MFDHIRSDPPSVFFSWQKAGGRETLHNVRKQQSYCSLEYRPFIRAQITDNFLIDLVKEMKW